MLGRGVRRQRRDLAGHSQPREAMLRSPNSPKQRWHRLQGTTELVSLCSQQKTPGPLVALCLGAVRRHHSCFVGSVVPAPSSAELERAEMLVSILLAFMGLPGSEIDWHIIQQPHQILQFNQQVSKWSPLNLSV